MVVWSLKSAARESCEQLYNRGDHLCSSTCFECTQHAGKCRQVVDQLLHVSMVGSFIDLLVFFVHFLYVRLAYLTQLTQRRRCKLSFHVRVTGLDDISSGICERTIMGS